MRFMVSWSGGKDSTASIILAHENREPLDEIIFSEVMYDIQNEMSGENPYHIHFVKEVAKPLFESWGYKVTTVQSEKDYLYLFNRIIEKPTKHMEKKGKRYGFPVVGMCHVQRDLKVKPINEYLRQISEPITQYIGIGIDEPKRLESLRKKKGCVSLFEKFGYTREMAKEKCMEYGLFSPCYELSNRGGCWFCPNAKLEEQREIKKNYPEVWSQFVSLEDQTDDVAYTVFNPFRRSLHEIDAQLEFDKGGNNGTNTQ